jgi:hypothetical protein
MTLRTALGGLLVAAGQTTAVVTGRRRPRLLVRPAGAPWPAPVGLPGDPRAYNTHTRKAHLSLRGAVAVAYRPAHGAFA